jgi:hypothetical protein
MEIKNHMKHLIIIICILLVNRLFAIEYYAKYSSSQIWYVQDVNKNVIIHGYVLSEIKLLNMNDNIIIAHLYKRMTPYSQEINEDITMVLSGDRYVFNFIDAYNNKLFGYFKFNSIGSEYYIDCIEFSDFGKNMARLFDETIILNDTTGDQDYCNNVLSIDIIASKLNKINPDYWPENYSELFINYIGNINDMFFYSTEYIWGESKRATWRLVVFNINMEYCGNYCGIPLNDVIIQNKNIFFPNIDAKYGNTINIGNILPLRIWIDGEVFNLEIPEV